jgi:hypothetical protein
MPCSSSDLSISGLKARVFRMFLPNISSTHSLAAPNRISVQGCLVSLSMRPLNGDYSSSIRAAAALPKKLSSRLR